MAAIKTVGAANYLEHPSTFVRCLAFKRFFAVHLLTEETGFLHPELMRAALDPSVIFVAHNALFEMRAWKLFMVPLGYPEIPLGRWKDTMAKAYSYGLPGKLKDACASLGLRPKGDGGSMLKLSKPRTRGKLKGTFYKYSDCPHDFEAMYEYNIGDVLSMEELDQELDDLPSTERVLWMMDTKMNDRGILFDMPLVNKILGFIDKDKAETKEAFNAKTGFNPTQNKVFKEYLEKIGIHVDDTTKDTIEKLEVPDEIKDVLDLFLSAGRRSLSKYNSIAKRVNASGILREFCQYHGAHTGRFAHRGVQLHNLFRPLYKIPALIDALKTCSAESFAALYEDFVGALASAIRGMIIARPGCRLIIGDFSQMEQRMLCWLAGQQDKLENYRNKIDPYKRSAAILYMVAIEAVTDAMRQTGKVSDLALGYNGGISAYVNMSIGYKIDLLPVCTAICKSATPEEMRKAEWSYTEYLKRCKRSKTDPVNKIVGLGSDIIKQRWRKDNPNIVKYWQAVENAAVMAVESKTGEAFSPDTTERVVFFMHKQFLMCKLPSGRLMKYPYPKVATAKRHNKVVKILSYRTLSINKQWIRETTYGGKLVENIVQAAQRDLLTDAMIRLVKAGYEMLFHVHDENVCEMPYGKGDKDEFERIMAESTWWTTDLPIGVKAFEAEHYDKR